jgi:mono/diheme cytochrome c family protein
MSLLKNGSLLLGLVVLGLLFIQPAQAPGSNYYGANISYFDGQYHWHPEGYFEGRWYPAGWYRWLNGDWYLHGYGFLYPPTRTVIAPPPSWREKLVDFAVQRERDQARIQEKNQEYDAYLRALQALGLATNMSGTVGAVQGNNPQLGSFGANGTTIYGYTYNSIKDIYNDQDPSILYQQAARLTERAQDLGDKAHSRFSDLLSKEGQNRARVAEILAQGQAASAALQAARAAPQRQEQTQITVQGTTPTPPSANAGANANFNNLLTARCASCHSGPNAKGGFQAQSYTSMSLEEKAKRVWSRLLSDDPKKRMPQGKDGQPAQPLSAEELFQFFTH